MLEERRAWARCDFIVSEKDSLLSQVGVWVRMELRLSLEGISDGWCCDG